MLTPAQKHFQTVMAARHGKTDTAATQAELTAQEQILHRLRTDQVSLKQIQSTQAKIELKKKLLPDYQGWIDGTIEGDSGRQDEVIVTLMLWAVDACEYELAVKIGRYVIGHDLTMPDRFERTTATVFVEEICDPILTAIKADADADASAYSAVLEQVAAIVDGKDMPDQVAAKLYKARGFALRNGTADEQAQALEYLRAALKLDSGAGVKKEIDKLARAVKKASAENTTDEPAAAESAAEEVAAEESATEQAESKEQ